MVAQALEDLGDVAGVSAVEAERELGVAPAGAVGFDAGDVQGHATGGPPGVVCGLRGHACGEGAGSGGRCAQALACSVDGGL